MKRIALTIGDPGGIGPEIIVKSLFCAEMRQYCTPIVIGNARVIRNTVKLTGLPLKVRSLSNIDDSRPDIGCIEVLDIKSSFEFKRGAPSKNAGREAVRSIKKAVKLALKEQVKAIVTAPVSKESLKLAGYQWPGQMFVSDQLKLILSTVHMPLKDVPKEISEKLVTKTIKLAEIGMSMLGVSNPRIAVAGLNPHAGESGMFGNEEMRFLKPAVQKARRAGSDISGPYPPDTVFLRAYRGDFDIVVCMYHDQGLIPFKMLAFDTGVNVTVGLPLIRTSPDHGTAFDIAGENRANPSCMLAAIKLAARLTLKKERERRETK
jgi:4-hydroxythreonine-4-phosphate dehydrogenase